MINLLWVFLALFYTPAQSYEDLGIAPDCSEQKISIQDILNIEKQDNVHTVIDFFKALPKKSLQTFTFVHSSNSFQHHKVSTLWPRVLRMSADGKIALSFVCNPLSQDYNRVEVLHYLEPPIAEWRTVSLDFRKQKLNYKNLKEEDMFPQSSFRRVHHNITTCAKCHSASGNNLNDIKPIIAQYKTWNGFYGSDDDVVHKNSTEYQNYLQFLAHAKDDPCFSTLPWPQSDKQEYRLYPYHEGFDLAETDLKKVLIIEETKKIKVKNYHLRPNLKFTDAFSHLMAQRLAWKLLRQPRYHKIAPLLMMESMDCDDGFITQELEKSLEGYNRPVELFHHTYMDPRTYVSRAKHLYAASLLMGVETADYNMHFDQAYEAYYNTGAAGAHRRDTSIARMAQSVLLTEMVKKFPQLKPYFNISRGVSTFFAPQDFSCIDDIAGQIYIDSIEDKNKFCSNLKSIYLSSQRTLAPDIKIKKLISDQEVMAAPQELPQLLLQSYGSRLSEQSIARGRKLAENHCTSCHAPGGFLPMSYQFLYDDLSLGQQFKSQPHFLWTLMTYLESHRMPKGKTLSDSEVSDLQAYFLSLTKH